MKDKRLYHKVADQLLERIAEGLYPPGSRLPGERELATQFGVSRVTIREAEISLQSLGYIEIKTGSGAYVLHRDPTATTILPTISAFELTEARLMFESEAAALAARHIDDDTLAQLAGLLERMSSKDPADEADSQAADQEFHRLIALASGNAAVKHVVEQLWQMRTKISTIKEVHDAICAQEDPSHRAAEHQDVFDALRNRDPIAARGAMQDHFRRLLTSMINVTEEQELRELRRKASESRERFLTSSRGSAT